MAKANKDGWIRHRGGKCPVEKGTLVDVRFRDGYIAKKCVALTPESEDDSRCAFDWSYSDGRGDIMAWRLHKPEDAKQEETANEAEAKDQRSTDASYLVVAAKQGVELAEHLRARYLATFEEKKALEVTIAARQNEIAMIEKEQEELRVKVRALGFDFYDAPKVEEDMSDYRKWKKGDLLEVIRKPESGNIPVGAIVEHADIEGDLAPYTKSKYHESWSIGADKLKFHSRPK